MTDLIPNDWLVPALPARIVVHWTGGSYTPSSLDKEHYHILIDGDGELVRGRYPISANNSTRDDGGYAAHVRNLNSGSIGVALCCMAGATESPFNAGDYPILHVQWRSLVKVCAQLCRHYSLEISRATLLMHAEVGEVYPSAPQRGKWDITVIPHLSRLRVWPPVRAGEELRTDVEREMALLSPVNTPEPHSDARRIYVIRGSNGDERGRLTLNDGLWLEPNDQ